MSYTLRSLVLLITLILIISTEGFGATISWDESVDGDIASNSFNFDEGINTITGSIYVDRSTIPIPYDDDNFSFDLPLGMLLTSVWLDASMNYLDQNGDGIKWGSVQFGITNSSSAAWVSIYPNYPIDQYVFDAILPGEGPYSFANASGYPQPGDAWFVNYTVEFNVAAVPIPGALWLLGSGLLGLVGFRRKLRR